jgi:hypothetical protein
MVATRGHCTGHPVVAEMCFADSNIFLSGRLCILALRNQVHIDLPDNTQLVKAELKLYYGGFRVHPIFRAVDLRLMGLNQQNTDTRSPRRVGAQRQRRTGCHIKLGELFAESVQAREWRCKG